MEEQIINIEYINQYLNNGLSKTEKQEFLNQLNSDSNFNNLYQEHLIFLKGLERVSLKQEVRLAHKSYLKAKWIRYVSISIAIIGMSILMYLLFSNKTESQSFEYPINNSKEVVVKDSTETKKLDKIEETTNSIEVQDLIINKKQTEGNQTKSNQNRVEKPIENKSEVKVATVISKDSVVKSNSKEIINQVSSINYESIKKVSERHLIDVENNSSIICKEGTKLLIEKHSFVDAKTNKLIRGKINLDITEYYKLSDIILGNLTTTSNGELLETGGMLYLKATRNNRELKLKDNKSIEIRFPKKKTKNGMKLFSGEMTNKGVNWKLQSQENDMLVEEIDFVEVIEEDVEVPFSVVENVPIYPGCENGTNQDRKKCMSQSIQKFVNRNFNTELTTDLDLNGRQRINVVFKINKEGLVTNVRSRAPHPLLAIEAERVVKSLPPMKPGMQRGKAVIVPYSLPIIFQVFGDNADISMGNFKDPKRQAKIDSVIKTTEAKIENGSAMSVSNSELNWYVFRSLELGWINCDRFVRSGKPNVKLKIKIKDSDGSDVKLVFKSMKSILRSTKTGSNTYYFGNVPKDEEVVLIAIKKFEDKFYLAIQSGKTDTITELDLSFKEMSLPEIKATIERFDLKF